MSRVASGSQTSKGVAALSWLWLRPVLGIPVATVTRPTFVNGDSRSGAARPSVASLSAKALTNSGPTSQYSRCGMQLSTSLRRCHCDQVTLVPEPLRTASKANRS